MSSAWGLQDIVAAACGPVVKLWSALDTSRPLKINEGTPVQALDFSHNNKVLAVGGCKHQVLLYSGDKHGPPKQVGWMPQEGLLASHATAVRFSPADAHITTGCSDGSIITWPLKGNREVGRHGSHRQLGVADATGSTSRSTSHQAGKNPSKQGLLCQPIWTHSTGSTISCFMCLGAVVSAHSFALWWWTGCSWASLQLSIMAGHNAQGEQHDATQQHNEHAGGEQCMTGSGMGCSRSEQLHRAAEQQMTQGPIAGLAFSGVTCISAQTRGPNLLLGIGTYARCCWPHL